MKITLYFLIILTLFSCTSYDEVQDFEGKWIITGMNYKGQTVYPKTVSNRMKISFGVTGFENAEKIEFKSKDLSILLPGFKSDVLNGNYNVLENRLIISSDNHAVSMKDKITSDIFCQSYTIEKGDRKGELILKSDLTNIRLFNEEIAIKEKINLTFNQF